MISKLHLRLKIFLAFLFVSSFSVVVGFTSYYFLQNVTVNYQHVVDVNMGNLQMMTDMKDSIRALRSNMPILVGFSKGHDEEVKAAFLEIEKEIVEYEKADKGYNDIPFVEGEEAEYKKVADSWKALKEKTDSMLAALKKDGSNEALLNQFFKEYVPLTDASFNALDNLMVFQNKESKKWVMQSNEMAKNSNRTSVIIILASLVIGVIVGFIMSKMLTIQLTNVISELNSSTPNLTESSASMSSLSTELSSCATEQAAAVQETASSLEEISAMIRRNTDNANNAKNSSSATLQSVSNGKNAVANMLNAMKEINNNNDSFNEFMEKNNTELSEMVKVITNISEKTKVINDIVFQTKLLSFNASVEAARAGEQGKGFAVVAEEVGNLAQMSGNAANEIKGLLDESIVKVNAIVSMTKSQVEKLVMDGKEKIDLGVSRAKDCDLALADISTNVMDVERLVAEVAQASGEQSLGIEEVNKAMGQIDEVTNQNASSSQSVSTNASAVMQLSSSIRETSNKLNLLLTGSKETIHIVKVKEPKKVENNKEVTKKVEVKKPELKIVEKKNDEKNKVVSLQVKKEEKLEAKKVVAVLPPKKAHVETPVVSSTAPKKKSGDLALPSYDDSRFEDV